MPLGSAHSSEGNQTRHVKVNIPPKACDFIKAEGYFLSKILWLTARYFAATPSPANDFIDIAFIGKQYANRSAIPLGARFLLQNNTLEH
ncbi:MULTISPECIES: hypothetical protein [Ensifer]|jgi:hypothetical protein|uniref:Uncharacterized protein n=1 Tax=Ensifer canadensis TaxID=555315 RepID=A0AAW4FJM6_9HYPH|nr:MULTISPECIES: hypothetical protein [Ensifer]MBD9486170.1 hypothetical protein [Ensifer sp. ENS11]MBM3091078.1 hypothetical protein [Ensifer canadensis]NOV15546.1 hypothetical protein [Ensifer canadensis]UBI75867.1 hypothetical protein J3R84_01510 [Ensifer canadensis]